jgi:hypothetical protein
VSICLAAHTVVCPGLILFAMNHRLPRRSIHASTDGRRALAQTGESPRPRLLPDTERPLQAELRTLERFSSLMADEGWVAHVAALAYDRIYARERFIFARRRGSPELAALAMHLLYCHRYGGDGSAPPR